MKKLILILAPCLGISMVVFAGVAYTRQDASTVIKSEVLDNDAVEQEIETLKNSIVYKQDTITMLQKNIQNLQEDIVGLQEKLDSLTSVK